ncbi:MAG: antibiotic biosynthesis monooxygenase, partial [Hyphomonadaceae bacterium]|nr:antibiotic biosynthesis monooxygenase [Hyphomonadaceae bacterium]
AKSQMEKTALLLGVGYCAKALIPHLKSAGYRITGTCRNAAKTEDLSQVYGIDVVAFDGTLSTALLNAFRQARIIISSIPPRDDGSDPVLSAFENPPETQADWIAYLSATSVYGDRSGQWVFEDQPLCPTTPRGINRVKAERAWMESDLPVHVFRLAGIYGPYIIDESRNPFRRLKSGKARAVIKPGHVVNRIHVGDIAAAIMASIKKPDPVTVYNLADDRPAPPQDVLNFAADLLDIERPPVVAHDDARLPDMARSFYTETKCVSNQRAKERLGWVPKYGTYRQGLMSIWKQDNDMPGAVILAGHVTAPETDVSAILAEMQNHIDLTHAESGCIRFDLWQDQNIPARLNIIGIFENPKAAEFHRNRMKDTKWKTVTKNIMRDYDTIGIGKLGLSP